MDIAKAFVRAAKAAGLNDVQIAAQVGVSVSTVFRWKTGEAEPRLKQYMALRRVLPVFAELTDKMAA